MSGEHSHPEYSLADPLSGVIVNLQTRVEQLAGRIATLEAQPRLQLDYAYLGKPTSPQTIGRTYTRLDQSDYDPQPSGWEHTLRYLNIAPTFRTGKVAGALRPRMMRADGDPTFYADIPLHADMLDDDGRTLVTQTYWEDTNGEGTWIELKCIGGLASAVLSTRYVKKAILH